MVIPQDRKAFSSKELLGIRERLRDSGSWQYLPDTDELMLSEAASLMMGIENSAGLGARRLFQALNYEASTSFDGFIDALVTGSLNGRCQSVQSKSRPRRVFKLFYNVFRRRDGTLDRLEGLVVDVSPFEDALLALNHRRSNARALFEKTGYIEWKATADGIIRPSIEWLALTGQPLEEQSENWPDTLTSDTRQKVVDAWWAAVESISGSFSCSFSAKLLGGETAHFVSSACKVDSDLSGVVEWVGRALRCQADEFAPGVPNMPGAIRAIEAPTLRASRALLGWSTQELAVAAGVSKSTVRRLESGESGIRARYSVRIVTALKRAGVGFKSADSGQFAVWRRHN